MDTRDFIDPIQPGFALADILEPALVCRPTKDDKSGVLHEMFQCLQKVAQLDENLFLSLVAAVNAREQIVSTGIGVGVALPHAKLRGLPRFFVVIGVLPQGVDWDALDGAPVRIVCLIVGPDDRPALYLQLLSKLTWILKDEERRKKILNLSQAEEIVKLFISNQV